MHMLLANKKLVPSSRRNRKIVIAISTILILGLAALLYFSISDNSDKKKTTVIRQVPHYNYVYKSSDIACKDVKAYPGAEETINVCGGTLVVLDTSTKSNLEVKIIQTTHFYKSGIHLDLTQLNTLLPDKTKLAITFFDNKAKTANTVLYVQ